MDIATQNAGLLDRALKRVGVLWRDMAAAVTGDEDSSIASQMQACLQARGGEVSARNRAAKLAQTYLTLDDARRGDFLRTLASFDADATLVRKAAEDLLQAEDVASAQARLRRALEPPHIRLLTQFIAIPDGVEFLVEMRANLLRLAKNDAGLRALDVDLRSLLSTLFDVGFLELKRIDWNSPAALLEKLVRYEAVHQIRSWRDLKNRLDSDRRCYAFFHPRMSDEPLIFVEVALVRGMTGSVQYLLDESAPPLDPRQADTAIFYSISNCQPGLAGISFGNFLIKQVVQLLSDELRNLKTYATLSPMPGFRRWLASIAPEELGTTDEESAALIALMPEAEHALAALQALLGRRGWQRDLSKTATIEPVLMRLAARYLTIVGKGARAADPVAHFHLSNGARIERINFLGDVSEKGLKESAALMVNYLYDPGKIEQYHEDYVGEGKRHASPGIRRHAR